MKEQITLVKGYFSPAEAADVLLSLINDKIKFHTVQTLNLGNESNIKTTPSEARIRDLKSAKNIVQTLVLKAHADGLELEIKSTIDIQLRHRLNSEKPDRT